jgi:hypothetical protein
VWCGGGRQQTCLCVNTCPQASELSMPRQVHAGWLVRGSSERGGHGTYLSVGGHPPTCVADGLAAKEVADRHCVDLAKLEAQHLQQPRLQQPAHKAQPEHVLARLHGGGRGGMMAKLPMYISSEALWPELQGQKAGREHGAWLTTVIVHKGQPERSGGGAGKLGGWADVCAQLPS